MKDVFSLFLAIHIAGGTLGLLAGSGVLFLKKGDRKHKIIGKIFALSMFGAGISSFVLATIHPNHFLFAVGVFTIFMTGTGWRFLSLKKLAEGQKPKLIDWGLQLFMMFGSLALIYLAFKSLFIFQNTFGVVPLLFSGIGFSFVWQDWQTLRGNVKTKNYWLTTHLQRMIGAYIASLTAFAVVNAPESISIAAWLLPTALVVPLIIKWTRKYKIEK